jgi:D-3-phosphoglycerate dehydrogenase
MVNASFVNGCKTPFYLLNLSRGEIVNTNDVLNAMETGHIAGFAADVLEKEQLPKFTEKENLWFDPLIQSADTVLAPHIGGWSHESYQRISEVLADEVLRRMSV